MKNNNEILIKYLENDDYFGIMFTWRLRFKYYRRRILNIGQLIQAFENINKDVRCQQILDHGSYRGYYEHLYIETSYEFSSTVGEVLSEIKGILNTVHNGYKGGEFLMNSESDVFIAEYGVTNKNDSTVALKITEYGVSFIDEFESVE